MKNGKKKIFLILFIGILVSISVIFTIYFYNVNICESVAISVNDDKTEVYAISPTGGRIEFVRLLPGSTYQVENRYLRDICIIPADFNNFEAELCVGDKSVKIDKSSLSAGKDNIYKINRNVFPDAGIVRKISLLSGNVQPGLLKYHFDKSKDLIFYFFAFLIAAYLIFVSIKYLKNNFKKHVAQFVKLVKNAVDFIKISWLKIIILFFISAVFPLLYFIYDNGIAGFLSLSITEYLLISGALIFPLAFMAYFSKSFKLNTLFWYAFFIIFILLVFVIKPSSFLYGFGFRDDVSKFFVKANGQNFLQCIFTPDSGYLNFFQNLVAFVILRILGFRQYFPEALQLTVAFTFSALFASFNLKSLRVFINNDIYRFFISLIFAISPFVFPASTYLFEVPFVAAAFLLLFYFVYFHNDTKPGKYGLYLLILSSVIMFLSKPVFIVIMPVLAALVIYHFFVKKNIVLTKSFAFLMLVFMIQMAVVFLFKDQVRIIPYSELGTNYEPAFFSDDTGFFKLLPAGIFMFFRQFVKLSGLGFIQPGWSNLILNGISVLFVGALFLHYLYKVLKKKEIFISLFCLTLLVVSGMSVLLFVNSVNPAKLVLNNPDFVNMSFYDMMRYPALLSPHRYLMLSSFANFMILIIFVSEIAEKYFRSPVIIRLIKISFVLFLAGAQYLITGNINKIKIRNYEKISYWRTYNHLIFSNPDLYYIPYNGFPEEKNCVKSGIDKIIDLKNLKEGTITVPELYPSAENWEIVQLILENNGKDYYPVVTGETAEKRVINASLVNGESQHTKALVYRFDNFYKFEKINIHYSVAGAEYHGLVRIVGKYE